MTRLLVCGGREYGATIDEQNRLFASIARLAPSIIIHGGASGADTLAGRWATANGVPVLIFRADWDRYGRNAGSIRNAYMISHGQPDRVLAAPGRAGTADMVRRARAAGLIVESVT